MAADERILANDGCIVVYELNTNEADGHLIASAPELLAACERAKKLLEPELVKEPDRTIFWELVAAIRKAKGLGVAV